MSESLQVEWKQVWKDDCLKWVCGLTNAEGGLRIFGRYKQGEIALHVVLAGQMLASIDRLCVAGKIRHVGATCRGYREVFD